MGLLHWSFVICIITTTVAAGGTKGQSIFGKNLISNPGAEARAVSMPQVYRFDPSTPDWNGAAGKRDVVPYGRFMDLSRMAPTNHLNNYFVGGWSNSSFSPLRYLAAG